jgi:hypothetical protein
VSKSVPKLSLPQIYPTIRGSINLNCCGDPDCGNFGLAPDFIHLSFVGRNAAARKLKAYTENPDLARGRGRYTLSGDDTFQVVSTAFEYAGDPHRWEDGKKLVCHHMRGNRDCEVSFSALSNEHFETELDRLNTHNGVLEGPVCGNCGARYLARPDEFVFNGTHGKISAGKNGRKAKPAAFRIIHKPCKGMPGARISVSLDHQQQEKMHDNVQLLRALVNGAGITTLRRLLADPDTGKRCGVSRVYNRILWLEKTLLAFERAKLKEWRDKREAEGGIPHMRIAHDDAVVSLNWETRSDRRLTPLQCSISADIDSGYVFRIDANIDTTIDPVAFVEGHYLDSNLQPKNIRRHYCQQSGKAFTVPAMHFQRPSGRLDEAALFASAESHWRVYAQRIEAAFKADGVLKLPEHIADEIRLTAAHRQALDVLRNDYFSFKETNRDNRGSFNGAVVKQTYTKAAHLACLRDFLPAKRLTIIGEQEANMARVVPHVFRELIKQDRFEWHVMTFDKEASEPQIGQRSDAFTNAFDAYKQRVLDSDATVASDWELLTGFCENTMRPSIKVDPHGEIYPFPISNFQSAQFPQLWVRSQVEIRGETLKTVGFPIIRKAYRHRLKQTAFDTIPVDQDLRDALARRYLNATIQPVSAFMNSMRERTKPTKRAGGKSARNGPSYINGATFNPAMLTAFLNIYRIYFNWFEDRPYAAHAARRKNTKVATGTVRTRRRPGSSATVEVPQVRKITPILDTPALRLGVDARRMTDLTRKAMNPRRVLYRPWLFHGTPLWKKFETR